LYIKEGIKEVLRWSREEENNVDENEIYKNT